MVFRYNVGLFYTKDQRKTKIGLPGFPDLFGVQKNTQKIFFIEVKTKKGTLSDTQRNFFERVIIPNYFISGIATSKEEALHIVENNLCAYNFEKF